MKKFFHFPIVGRTALAFLTLLVIMPESYAQKLGQDILGKVHYRSIGPTRQGGRYIDFALIDDQPTVFYAALASGGVWRTDNNGQTFTSIFDDAGAISVGDIAVDPTDIDVIWVGTGEANNSRTAYYGDGVYKSTDGGETWKNMGLKMSQHVGRIVIHPTNTDIVWVAAEGPLYSNNEECGVYKTTNGGNSWEKVLSVKRGKKHIGVVDLVMEPGNPDVLYAAAYDKERKPWTFNAGGPESAIYKTTDGGAKWEKLGGGLPEGIIGRIGVDVSVSHPNILYANVENNNVEGMSTKDRWKLMKEGQPLGRGEREIGAEVYRSDDYGKTWKKVGDKVGGSPCYYYQQVRIDPTDPDHVYIVGIGIWETKNGGDEWVTPYRFGGDNHALWINPANPDHQILGYDHGMGITYDAGKNWYHPDFKDVGQFVAVGFDYRYPYYVYGGLQDNGSAGGPSSKKDGGPIRMEDWNRVGGGDGMYNEVDPNDWRILYNESQNGPISRRNLETGESKSIRYREMDRWAWNAPIVISSHNSNTIYHGGNKVVKSTNQGESWREMSPDLTAQDEVKIAGTGNIQYCTIVTMSESPVTPNVFWVGTDDGKVWVTQDGGEEWTEVTENIPDNPGYWVSRVEASYENEGTAYVTITGYRNDDFRPFIWKTEDYGASWTSISDGLPDNPLCVIREHPRNAKLLFVGSTKQVHVSIDAGKTWNDMRNNMPYVAVEDLKIHPRENDLIVGTHGRSIWIADISYLEELCACKLKGSYHLFRPENKILYESYDPASSSSSNFAGESEAPGTPIRFYINPELENKNIKLKIIDMRGKVIFENEMEAEGGVNEVVWNQDKRIRKRTDEELKRMERQMERFRQYLSEEEIEARMANSEWITGPAGPGRYTVVLTVEEASSSQEFELVKDHWN